MSEFLDNETQVEGEDSGDDCIDESSDSENLIIDDDNEGNDLSFYRSFDNNNELLENVGDT